MQNGTAQALGHLLKRGVSISPFQYRGRIVLLMVDHGGNIRRQVVMRPGGDVLRAMAQLRAELDRIDPTRPPLALVKDRPHPTPPPANDRPWEDQLAYHLRIARARAKSLRLYR